MRHVLILAAAVAAGWVATMAPAQEADRAFLADFLQDSLSGAGRQVTITGLTGALSSQATIQSLTIADNSGIWLTISGVTLDWSRSSLLSGALEVSELSAESIVLDRIPDAGDSTLPAPEAAGFNLPELPVSIDIGQIAATRIVLGEAVFGQRVEGSLDAAMQLADGAGAARLALNRSDDGPDGDVALEASFDNASRQLMITLEATEGAGGLVTTLLQVPGAPAAEFSVTGAGPIEDFSADVVLATDGEVRLGGTITLTGTPQSDYRLQAGLSGNLVPLLLPEMVDFFGPSIDLRLDARRAAGGSIIVDTFAVQARSLTLEGQGRLAADGLPEEIAIKGRLASPDGSAVLLPFADLDTRVDEATFNLSLTQVGDAGWKGEASVLGLDRVDLSADRLELRGSGRIGRTPAGRSLGGTLTLLAEGLLPTDPGLAAATGPTLTGGLRLHYLDGSGALTISDLRLTGQNVAGLGHLRIEGLQTGFLTRGRLEVTTDDLARFSLLAGRPLGGAGTVRLSGLASPLSGYLDGMAEVSGQGLTLGIDALDRLLTGGSLATLSLLRDVAGTTLRSFSLMAGPLSATASGKISTDGSALTGEVSLTDLGVLGPDLGGSLRLLAQFDGTLNNGTISLDGTATGLRTGVPEANRVLAGTSNLTAKLALQEGRLRVNAARLGNPQLTVTATETGEGLIRTLDLDARLANLGLLMPDLQGPLTLAGQVTETDTGYVLDLAGRGPGQVDGRVSGTVSSNLASADVAIAGTGQAGLANILLTPRAIAGPVRYDLRLSGPLRLSSLSGRVTLANGRLSDPGLGFALEGIEATADIAGGQARIAATSRLSSGGRLRIDGPVGLSQSYASQLGITLDAIRLYDPELFRAVIDGTLGVSGPLANGATITGALALSEAELQVPESGFETAGALTDIRHVNEPAEVRATRVRAGLLGGANGTGQGRGTSARYGLDVTVSAPSRIFIRGRGIDAELGGQVRLLGTTDAIAPSGGFSLIRGRLDILGKRLDLAQADLALEGSFVPMIQVVANTESDGIISSIRLEGPADDPAVSFTSSPDLPQEEVLARLLFGRGLDSISALQAAQLANAVAVLAGRGGIGLVNRLRQGFGLDDLDLVAAEDGSTALTAGKYISENVYTEVEIEQGGRASVNLNLDLRQGVTVRAGIGADNTSSLGIFIERDY